MARVLLLHYTAPPIIGGVESVMAQHRRVLFEHGYDVELVAGRSGPASGASDPSLTLISELDSRHPENQRIAYALEEGILLPEFAPLEKHIANLLEPLLAKTDLVIVHNAFNFHFNLPLTAALHRLLDCGTVPQLIAWCHDVSRYVNPASGAPQRSGFPWDLLRTFRSEVSYVAVSPQRQRTLAQVLGCAADEISVIPNGVDPAQLLGLSHVGARMIDELQLLEADLILLMPVRITRAKNIEFALRVVAALKARGMQLKLVVTGPPDPHSPEIKNYFQQLQTLRDDLGLRDAVVFVYEGTSQLPSPLHSSPALVAELYRVCDIVFMPSHREGFALPVLEAGMAGKPVFCTDLPVLELLAREDVHLIQRDESPARVAARLWNWAENTTAHRLRRRVRREYNWTAVFQSAFKPLLDRHLWKAQRVT